MAYLGQLQRENREQAKSSQLKVEGASHAQARRVLSHARVNCVLLSR